MVLGIFRGMIISGFLRWCRIVHPPYLWLATAACQPAPFVSGPRSGPEDLQRVLDAEYRRIGWQVLFFLVARVFLFLPHCHGIRGSFEEAIDLAGIPLQMRC